MENTNTPSIDFYNYLIAKGYSESTTQGIIKSATHFLEWLSPQHIEITTLSYNDITAYISHLDKKEVSKITQNKYLGSIKHYLNYLVSAGEIPYNPALALKLKNTKHKALHSVLSPEELQELYKHYNTETKKYLIAPPQHLNELAKKRNKVIIGLLVYQGLSTQDVSSLEVKHVQLREGKLQIPSARRKDERSLSLEPHQIFELSDYIQDTRKALLKATNTTTDHLFISVSGSTNLANTFTKLLNVLKKQQPKLTSLSQIRAIVISHWLKLYNTRKVQQMAGHRYISSTEIHKRLNTDDLKQEVEKYYPEI